MFLETGVAAVARALKRADRVLVLAGAGFTEGSTRQDGVTLPDYRTPGAFAKQYAPLAALGVLGLGLILTVPPAFPGPVQCGATVARCR